MLNLIDEPWIPVLRHDGATETIAPWQITEQYRENPIVAVDSCRPDFNGSLVQFLIGLCQTAWTPNTTQEWFRRFRTPPTTDQLREIFSGISNAFMLEGEGARFMQDLNLQVDSGVVNTIDKLLIEMPGENTVLKNIDFFLKRNTVNALCPACAAMALYNLQTNGPSGGRGHRTGLRGGGPLTTLVIGRTLWETIWLNVLEAPAFARHGNQAMTAIADIFPWMESTRTSEMDQATTLMDANPAQIFWAMPRRIRLDTETTTSGTCDLCGGEADTLFTQYSTKDRGINYKGGWRHTLTPYIIDKKTGEAISIKGQPGGISYRNWLGLIQNDEDTGKVPSDVVLSFRTARHRLLLDYIGPTERLWAFGYDMDKMKARCYYEATIPLMYIPDDIRDEYDLVTGQMIRTADLVAFSMRSSIRKALGGGAENKKGSLPELNSLFWQNTEPDFYQTLTELKDNFGITENENQIKLKWLESLQRQAFKLFDEFSQSDLVDVADPKKIAIARRDLRRFTGKQNKKIRATLGLPEI